MRYYLVSKKSGNLTYLSSKRALLDWIVSHFYALTYSVQCDISVHRVVKRPCVAYDTVLMFYQPGSRICSLCEYILKHSKSLTYEKK